MRAELFHMLESGHPVTPGNAVEYWIPAFAGMTLEVPDNSTLTASDHQSDRMLDEMPEGGKQLGSEDTVDDTMIARQSDGHLAGKA